MSDLALIFIGLGMALFLLLMAVLEHLASQKYLEQLDEDSKDGS